MIELVFESEKIRDFIQNLKEISANKVDMIIPASSLYINNDTLSIKNKDLNFKILPWAKRQLAWKLQIPIRFYNRLERDHPQLLNTILTTLLEKSEDRYLVRTLNGEVRAILSDKFKAYESYDIFSSVLDYAMKINKNITFKSAYITDLFVELELVDQGRVYKIDIDGKPDLYYTGISIKNSEVGYSAFEVNILLYRQICSNGLISPMFNKNFRRIHIGRKVEDEEYWNEDLIAENRYLINELNNLVHSAFDENNINKILEKLSEYSKQSIPSSIKFIDASKKVLGLSEQEKDMIWQNLESKTRFGFINAITQTAQYFTKIENKKPSERLRLEELAGELLFKEQYWRDIESEMLKKEDKTKTIEEFV